ncbi:MAG: GMC family oxidoreductase [bacterium]|nr:GMC family oxidoreductase [bacterium]
MSGSDRGAVRVFAEYERDFTEQADVVVVGSGPCGSVVAYELAARGKRVVLLEEGPPFTPQDFELDGAFSMSRTMREAGLRTTRGTVIPTMQAIALGGGSLVNSAICVRPPDFVFEGWEENFEIEGTRRADLDPHFDAVEAFLGIAPTPDEVQGQRNLLFRDGCDALGIDSEPIARNARGCRGSGECFTGCRSRAKQSMDISYLPAAIHAGARVLTSLQVQEVLTEGRRASGVRGQVVEPFSGRRSHRFQIDAKAVVLAAGCMATPILLSKSGNLANRSGQVGRNLQFHPGIAILGVFPEKVDPGFGATQGYQSLAFLREGFKLETLWAPAAVLAVRFPGYGHDLKTRLAEVPYAANWDAIASCHRSLGTVRSKRGASLDPILTWRFHSEDAQVLGGALYQIARIFFAAGARKILPGVYGVPGEIHSIEEADVLRTHRYAPTDFVTASNHAFCTTRMHGDPAKGVVDPRGRAHEMDGLFLVDTGIFPRCTSVNPMFTGMALAHRSAAALADQL